MRSIYLNIGSNKGDRLANIERAVALVTGHPLFAAGRIRTSTCVYSAPVGFDSTNEFVNIGVAIDFDDDSAMPAPFDILDATQSIERSIAPDSPHRNADGTYRDRVIDIDIVDIDGVKMAHPRLTVPHPRAGARAFVMKPMEMLAPGWYPTNTSSTTDHRKKTIADMGRDSVETFKTKPKKPIAVILDNIRSLNNVGSVFRTSDAFCVETVALCGITACPPAPEIHKTALGAEDSVDWEYFENTLDAVETLRSRGFTILCLEQVHDSVSLEKFSPRPGQKYAIVVGNEVNGVDQQVVDACDMCVEIPQAGTKHSLNVSVSAAIAIWHLFASF